MFDVAFSRRMCCSRAARVRTKQRLPFLSVVSPTRRPGTERTFFMEQASMPTPGPPALRGMPKLLPSPQTMSAPQLPGFLSSPQAMASEKEAISRIPLS